ncbi:AAA domain-containing protein [Alkalihalobacillus sp. MEB130]|uniref:AAA domain-containing protein n=1 Tax=Alkalihalobacillus sp. MEB130 TaxID=2976704 RepID=UPI0028DDE436|nr:AAA domain-containing protein [Alkalihalobacillus sp. MEB130]MDT8860158.1 AAA domain-containing protein [Alkalihalobacillus sp. MEB130]
MIKIHSKTYRCPVTLTNKAKDKMRELKLDERSFFSLEKSFRVYIEKYPQTEERPLSVALYFDNEKNVRLADVYAGIIVVLHCVVEKDRFIVTNVTTKAARVSVQTNWRRSVDLEFDLNIQPGRTVSLDLLSFIHEMPVAQESSLYVKKRIASWEGYLKIQERTADIPDMIGRYLGLTFNGDFTRMTITGCELGDKEWRSLKDLSVKLKGIDQDVGKVLKANRGARTVEVELNKFMEARARQQRFDLKEKEVTFSNFATLSQVKRLRQGFRHLENGLAANPELEQLLFENKPPVKTPKRKNSLQFHNRLNEFQQEAVIGAMSAEDLYVIQGPPGTGKTTVISEICLQNARAGLRTLVASQSNLAVDNALGRLLANKDIRILRVGRTESIEEEGKKFIEENVGQYWKEHTLHEVSTQFETRKKREAEIEAEWAENELTLEQLEPELARLEAEIESKKLAKEQLIEMDSFIDKQNESVKVAEQEQQVVELRIQDLIQSQVFLTETIEKDVTSLRGEPNIDTIQREYEEIQQIIHQLEQSIVIQEVEEEIAYQLKTTERTTSEWNTWSEETTKLGNLLAKITNVKQIDGLKWILLEQNLERTTKVQQLIDELHDIRAQLKQFEKLKDYHDRLNGAVSYIEQLLHSRRVPLSQIEQQAINRSEAFTAVEIDQFLDDLRSKLKSSNIYPKELVKELEGLYSRRQFIRQKAKRLQSYDTYKTMAQEAFGLLKQELLDELQQKKNESQLVLHKWQREMAEQNKELDALQKKLKLLLENVAEPIPDAKETLLTKEAKARELQNQKEQYWQVKERITLHEQQLEHTVAQLQEEKQKLEQFKSQLEQLVDLITQKETERIPLLTRLQAEPEKAHEEVLKKVASCSFTRESLKQEKQKLPIFQSIQGQWLSLLEEANDHDLDEIRKLYVKHANVIGTTCVASARKDFIDNFPVFDVVIIDEVSKATPPELLLPMLKGKKVILVGDHHQLPPLLGDDTLEETLQEMADESDDFEGEVELKKLLKESLFERLFKNLPKTNKTMLAIQYRMHENIMETISPFYEQENERLQCGLPNSDSARDHLLESPLIQRDHHLLWLDIPNEPAFFEERMKGGKSLFNPAELKRIEELLKELDTATAQAKQAGRMKADEKKSIGVISFYGEQVKRIDRLIHQELRLEHVTIRTGTVDRFQGMEMDVILLSMVRNHDNKQDDIGFAKDYRRLNVALSRARELLVLIGSTKMFTEKARQADTRRMYKHVLESVKKQDGLRMHKEVSIHG